MSSAIPTVAPEPLSPPGKAVGRVDALVAAVVLSVFFHIVLSLLGASRFAEPPPAWQRPPDTPHIDAEIVPPPPRPVETIAGEATSAPDEALPPVDTALVGSMIADSGKILLACRKCTLAGANFDKAYLRLASLQGADMRKAKLSHADLTGPRLAGAKLAGADITRAYGLSNEQLALACGDEKTLLPEGLVVPKCRK